MLKVYDVSICSVKAPAFVPISGIYLGWKLDSTRICVKQVSYRAVIVDTRTARAIWDSGLVESDRSVHIPVDCPLPSRADCALTISVTDNYGDTAQASISFSTGIRPQEWAGVWIKPCRHIEGWAPYLRTRFACEGQIRRAKLYVCGLGCGEYYINGKKVCEDLIDPPATNYERAVLYRIYDVTELLGERNAFAALLGEGWYSQSRVWGSKGMKYGDVCLKAQIEIEYDDGHRETIATNTESWKYKYSPIVLNNLYGGETYDSRLETPDFADPEADEEEWGRVIEDDTARGELTLCMMPPVRVVRSLPAAAVRQASGMYDGAWIVDFGENVAGFVEIHIPNAPRGAQVTLRFAETIQPDGTLDFRSIGSFATQCIQQDIYIARGDEGGECWRPRFTYHAFRYMEITGYHDLRAYGSNPELSIGVCHVLSTDLAQTGWFQSSCQDMNHLQAIMMSTFRSNYHGFPEDCPGREKCGWLGDAQLVCNTGMMNYDMEASYEKYLRDIRTSDDVYQVWQNIAPGKRGCGEAAPLWGCAQVILPYWMYRYYGNEAAVRDNWDMMEKWMRHECADAAAHGEDLIIYRGIGDHSAVNNHGAPVVDNGAAVGEYGLRRMPVAESSTAMFYETALRMEELAKNLGLDTCMDYAALSRGIKESFIRHFWDASAHRYGSWGSCGAALALGLYPDGEKDALVKALSELMADEDYAMSTGIYGHKYLVQALSENGYGDLAMKMLFTRDHISFGTMMDQGATSLWENLDTRMVGQPREQITASFNHPMHSSFAHFLYAQVGGIRPLEPGFASFEISPCRYSDIPAAIVRHVCPYGEIRVSFQRFMGQTAYEITVPANTVAFFRAGGRNDRLGSGQYTMTVKD